MNLLKYLFAPVPLNLTNFMQIILCVNLLYLGMGVGLNLHTLSMMMLSCITSFMFQEIYE